jgi:hypothetical protein
MDAGHRWHQLPTDPDAAVKVKQSALDDFSLAKLFRLGDCAMKRYKVKLTFIEPLLASSPASADVYAKYIASRARADNAKKAAKETRTLRDIEDAGWSVFHCDDKGIFLYDYKLRGFFKEAATAITGATEMTAFKSKIDRWLFVAPRRIHVLNKKGRPLKPSAVECLERPLRAMTQQGPRVTVKRSDMADVGCSLEFTVLVLPHGQTEITESRIRSWLEYGELNGLGEWRSGGYGRFTFSMRKA